MGKLSNAEAMDRLLQSMESAENFQTVCELFSDEIVVVQDRMLPGRTWNGRAEVESLWKEIEDGFTDYRLPVHNSVRDDEKIVLFGHFEGNFTGDQYGTAGEGYPVRWEFRDAYWFEDGEIVKIDWLNDTLTVAVMTRLIDADPRPGS